ncbi:uncharacterized protein LOC144634314 isoform X2 [Oculina patagonica]
MQSVSLGSLWVTWTFFERIRGERSFAVDFGSTVGRGEVKTVCFSRLMDETRRGKANSVHSSVFSFWSSKQTVKLFPWKSTAGSYSLGKPGKPWNLRISFSRPGKSWNLSVSHRKSWKWY